MKKFAGRIGALLIAALFLITSLGFSFLVIWETHQQSKQSQQQSQLQQSQNQQTSCAIGTAAGSTQAKPQVFIPTGSITKLQTTDIKVGSGQTAAAGDCLQVKYQGSLAKGGNVFDENFDKSELLKFQLGQGSVIPGWDQGLVGMKVGGERRLVIPAALGYGSQGSGSIPANADLVFDVVLVKIGQ